MKMRKSSYIITKKSLECMWYCAIYVCMIMKKKNRFISSKIKKKEVQKFRNSEKKFQYLCPADDPHPDGLISKNPQFLFWKKNYTQRIIEDKMEWYLTTRKCFYFFFWYNNTVDICGHYISCFSSEKQNSSDKKYPCCSGTVPSGT